MSLIERWRADAAATGIFWDADELEHCRRMELDEADRYEAMGHPEAASEMRRAVANTYKCTGRLVTFETGTVFEHPGPTPFDGILLCPLHGPELREILDA